MPPSITLKNKDIRIVRWNRPNDSSQEEKIEIQTDLVIKFQWRDIFKVLLFFRKINHEFIWNISSIHDAIWTVWDAQVKAMLSRFAENDSGE